MAAEGDLGVGAPQYEACKGCEHFGCAVSAMPGSVGEVTPSLCFDSACHTQKVAARRRAERAAGQAAPEKTEGAASVAAGVKPARKPKPSNQTPQRVLQYRVEQWRRWVANALMTQPERNARVLVALTLSSQGAALRGAQCLAAVTKITGAKIGANPFKESLEQLDALSADSLPSMVRAVTASAAFGVDQRDLEALLNYLEVDEERCFRLSREFLDLLTKSELESLAAELKLKAALGTRFNKLREGKREAFIEALLSVPGVDYQGLVPKVMRYPREMLRDARPCEPEEAGGSGGEADEATSPAAFEANTEPALP